MSEPGPGGGGFGSTARASREAFDPSHMPLYTRQAFAAPGLHGAHAGDVGANQQEQRDRNGDEKRRDGDEQRPTNGSIFGMALLPPAERATQSLYTGSRDAPRRRRVSRWSPVDPSPRLEGVHIPAGRATTDDTDSRGLSGITPSRTRAAPMRDACLRGAIVAKVIPFVGSFLAVAAPTIPPILWVDGWPKARLEHSERPTALEAGQDARAPRRTYDPRPAFGRLTFDTKYVYAAR